MSYEDQITAQLISALICYTDSKIPLHFKRLAAQPDFCWTWSGIPKFSQNQAQFI